MRLGKIVTLLLAGFLTFGSLNAVAVTKHTKPKSSILTKKQTTSKTTKHAVKKAPKTAKKAVKKGATIQKKSAKELHKNVARKHFQTGLASYYSNQFNGARTASGETFSNAKLTAAHRTLPFGTLIEVTNVRNGRSVVVRVNDRGPYAHSRVLDLSSAAAKQIGMHLTGTATVRITVLDKHAKASASELYALN